MSNFKCPDGYVYKKWPAGKNLCEKTGELIPRKTNNTTQVCTGNPINVATGYKWQSENDVHIGSLRFTRTYNSYWANLSNEVKYNPGSHLPSIGPGWTTSFHTYLDVSGQWVKVHKANGQVLVFAKKSDNTYQSENDVFDTLSLYTGSEVEGAYYHYVNSASNHSEYYDENGWLLKIKKTHEEITFSYQDDKLSSVTDSKGNQFLFNYGELGYLSSLQFSDQKIEYGYSDNGNLISVKFADGNTQQYHYENTAFPYALTGLTNENGDRFATWHYDDQGRAISSEHANGTEKATLSFNDSNSTTVTNPLGKKTTYHFKLIEGVKHVTKVEGHASTSCAAANRDYTYYDNGLLKSKTDWKGVATSYEYNDRGLVTRQVVAEGTPQAQVTTTEWHDTFTLPTKITQQGITTEFTYDEQGRLVQQRQVSSK
ncbi:RHS repeat protein [Zooshikella sp. WH53]|uniref:RHS repeat protein n=2 Tax=Zooshikella harenae TaxID=2827238 RepID=A0ABS5ZIV2_9GAMM|nr:RHS repeat protein [Zooshikella harenae]